MTMVILKIKRQNDPTDFPYWEEFEVEVSDKMTVALALSTTPVIWECSCLDGMCGACAMIINGKAQLACLTVIDDLDQSITIEPLSKFPVVRDLRVDRTKMFKTLSNVGPWNEIDNLLADGLGQRQSAKEQADLFPYSECVMCGICLETCPQISGRSLFTGAFVFAQTFIANHHYIGCFNKDERLDLLLQRGGLPDCAGAGNCETFCPKGIPLTEAIARLERNANSHSLFSLSCERQ